MSKYDKGQRAGKTDAIYGIPYDYDLDAESTYAAGYRVAYYATAILNRSHVPPMPAAE